MSSGKKEKKIAKRGKKLRRRARKPGKSVNKLESAYNKYILEARANMSAPDARFRPRESEFLSLITTKEQQAVNALAYLHNLIDPEAVPGTTYPDDFTGPTARYQSVMTFETAGNVNASTLTTDKGRFSWVFKPCLARSSVTYTLAGPHALASHTADNDPWIDGFSAASYVPLQDTNANELVPQASSSTVGLALRARPVGMSVWAQFLGSSLNNQGSIAAAVLPNEAWPLYLAASATAGNRYARWEDLSASPGAYQGPVKNGAYVWWRPQSSTDTMFYDLDSGAVASAGTAIMQQVSYPMIVISGQMPPGDATGYPGLVRFRVCVNYEYQTASRVVPTEPSETSPEALHLASRVLARVPQAMANEEHSSWINTIIKAGIGGLGGFFLGGPVGAAVGALSGAGVSFLK